LLKIDFPKIWPELMALVPVYAADGTNDTNILLEGKDALFSPLKTKTLLGQLCRAFLLELQVARLAFSRVCGRCYAIPVAIRPGLVLLPVRAREARVKDDGTRAYVVKDKIREFVPEITPSRQRGTRIYFRDGSSLLVLHRYSGVRDMILSAELVAREAAALKGEGSTWSVCQVKERPPEYCCVKCQCRERCFPKGE